MDKPAESSAPVARVDSGGWSPRAFADRSIEPEKVRGLLEAARWAPSSSNGQPRSTSWRRRTSPRNLPGWQAVSWMGTRGPSGPLCSCWPSRQTNFSHNDKPNRHAFHDVGLANENLVLQATAMGLVAHQMAGFRPRSSSRTVSDSRGEEPLRWSPSAIRAKSTTCPNRSASAKRPPLRKPLAEMVFTGKWANV